MYVVPNFPTSAKMFKDPGKGRNFGFKNSARTRGFPIRKSLEILAKLR